MIGEILQRVPSMVLVCCARVWVSGIIHRTVRNATVRWRCSAPQPQPTPPPCRTSGPMRTHQVDVCLHLQLHKHAMETHVCSCSHRILRWKHLAMSSSSVSSSAPGTAPSAAASSSPSSPPSPVPPAAVALSPAAASAAPGSAAAATQPDQPPGASLASAASRPASAAAAAASAASVRAHRGPHVNPACRAPPAPWPCSCLPGLPRDLLCDVSLSAFAAAVPEDFACRMLFRGAGHSAGSGCRRLRTRHRFRGCCEAGGHLPTPCCAAARVHCWGPGPGCSPEGAWGRGACLVPGGPARMGRRRAAIRAPPPPR